MILKRLLILLLILPLAGCAFLNDVRAKVALINTDLGQKLADIEAYAKEVNGYKMNSRLTFKITDPETDNTANVWGAYEVEASQEQDYFYSYLYDSENTSIQQYVYKENDTYFEFTIDSDIVDVKDVDSATFNSLFTDVDDEYELDLLSLEVRSFEELDDGSYEFELDIDSLREQTDLDSMFEQIGLTNVEASKAMFNIEVFEPSGYRVRFDITDIEMPSEDLIVDIVSSTYFRYDDIEVEDLRDDSNLKWFLPHDPDGFQVFADAATQNQLYMHGVRGSGYVWVELEPGFYDVNLYSYDTNDYFTYIIQGADGTAFDPSELLITESGIYRMRINTEANYDISINLSFEHRGITDIVRLENLPLSGRIEGTHEGAADRAYYDFQSVPANGFFVFTDVLEIEGYFAIFSDLDEMPRSCNFAFMDTCYMSVAAGEALSLIANGSYNGTFRLDYDYVQYVTPPSDPTLYRNITAVTDDTPIVLMNGDTEYIRFTIDEQSDIELDMEYWMENPGFVRYQLLDSDGNLLLPYLESRQQLDAGEYILKITLDDEEPAVVFTLLMDVTPTN